MNKGTSEYLYYIFLAFVVLAVLGLVYQLFIAGNVAIAQGEDAAATNLRASSMLSKIISSSGCLSTGEAGILERSKLESKEGSSLDCVYTPNFKVLVELAPVSDIDIEENIQEGYSYNMSKDDVEYTFGDNFSVKLNSHTTMSTKVGVKESSSIEPYFLRASFLSSLSGKSDIPTALLSFTKSAAAADKAGEANLTIRLNPTINYQNTVFRIIDSDRICLSSSINENEYSYESVGMCKNLKYTEMEDENSMITIHNSARFKFESTQNGVRVTKL